MRRASITRMHELDRMIRTGRLRTASGAARELEVSRRTVERDIDTLRSLGAELTFDRARGRYAYANGANPLPAQWLNARELAIVLVAERALRVFTNTSFDSEIHPVFNKLLDPVRHDRKLIEYVHDLCNSVHFYRPVQPARDIRGEFSTVLDAVMGRRRLSMSYSTSGRAPSARREVEPYALVNNGGDWYIVGHCRQASEVRTFALSQVSEPRLEPHYFIVPAAFDVRQYLEQGFGRMRGVRARRVVLRINPPSAGWVGRTQWHPSQRTRALTGDALEVRLQCPITDSLVRWILQMGGDVRVVSPASLRAKVRIAASALATANAD